MLIQDGLFRGYSQIGGGEGGGGQKGCNDEIWHSYILSKEDPKKYMKS